MHAGRDPHPFVKEADVIVTVNAMVPWVSDHVELRPGCKVIAIGPMADMLRSKHPWMEAYFQGKRGRRLTRDLSAMET